MQRHLDPFELPNHYVMLIKLLMIADGVILGVVIYSLHLFSTRQLASNTG